MSPGTDVHLHFEIKVAGEWLHYSSPDVGRWYRMFGKMAGVRDSYEVPIAEPKGLPDNCSKVTLLETSVREGHSHSWFNAQEIKALFDWCHVECWKEQTSPGTLFGYLFGYRWDWWENNRKDFPSEIENIRLVFWFDS